MASTVFVRGDCVKQLARGYKYSCTEKEYCNIRMAAEDFHIRT